ncbi:hypothetical protein F444_23222 [Phytophthora nicotianae P1976]|uniref:Uncharacterized protein n=1 Tax=Phytophthora nicotianae P1976 TaxID=1317066 RepID=A0A080YVJ1_PHYNI|nr:hypothetical protein F444_23222 [Phytophthora nicotianae P1976]
MANRIDNWGAALPKEYRSDSLGDIKQLGIKKLFRGIILAPSNSGKTNMVFHLVKNSPNVYSHLHIVARNPDQELYNYMKDKLAGYITIYDPSEPPRVDDIQKDPRGGIQLVIIDDYSSDKKLQHDVFSHFFIRGRHKRLSTLFLTHSWFATDKLIRLNSEYLWILKANSKRDLKMVIADFTLPGITLERLIRAYNEATREKGQALMIDNVRSVLRFNFNENPINFGD